VFATLDEVIHAARHGRWDLAKRRRKKARIEAERAEPPPKPD
jgi:hypothetical protein